MKTILIATNNASKLDVIRPLLISAGFDNHTFIRPVDLGVHLDVHEHGSLQNRAKLKSVAAYEVMKEIHDAPRISLYVGADDGIRIDKEHKTYAASKEATDRILQGEGVKAGDGVTIVRAFAFTTPDGVTSSCITRVPMTFLGNPKNIQRQEGVYPLEHVLAYKGSTTPIAELSQTERDTDNFTYMLPMVRKHLVTHLL